MPAPLALVERCHINLLLGYFDHYRLHLDHGFPYQWTSSLASLHHEALSIAIVDRFFKSAHFALPKLPSTLKTTNLGGQCVRPGSTIRFSRSSSAEPWKPLLAFQPVIMLNLTAK